MVGKVRVTMPLEVALGRPADRALDDQVDRVLVAAVAVGLGHRGDALDRAVGGVAVPGIDLVLAHVGEAQQHAVVANAPDDLVGLGRERPFLDLVGAAVS
jgi:hypothetical protein